MPQALDEFLDLLASLHHRFKDHPLWALGPLTELDTYAEPAYLAYAALRAGRPAPPHPVSRLREIARRGREWFAILCNRGWLSRVDPPPDDGRPVVALVDVFPYNWTFPETGPGQQALYAGLRPALEARGLRVVHWIAPASDALSHPRRLAGLAARVPGGVLPPLGLLSAGELRALLRPPAPPEEIARVLEGVAWNGAPIGPALADRWRRFWASATGALQPLLVTAFERAARLLAPRLVAVLVPAECVGLIGAAFRGARRGAPGARCLSVQHSVGSPGHLCLHLLEGREPADEYWLPGPLFRAYFNRLPDGGDERARVVGGFRYPDMRMPPDEAPPDDGPVLLSLGMEREQNAHLLRAAAAAGLAEGGRTVWVKPHPSRPLAGADLPRGMLARADPIPALVREAAFTVCGPSTTGVECLAAGRRPIICASRDFWPLCQLAWVPEVCAWTENAEELRRAILQPAPLDFPARRRLLLGCMDHLRGYDALEVAATRLARIAGE
ncbi:MAG: hypothetical protein HY719_12920 [Planctomycetes bacterium]|nr:hypothetical protein [Planctomycetota bacterium]